MKADSDLYVAQWFEDILRRCTASGPAVLPYAEQVVYYVVAVRSEADINGFCSVFEQLLHHEEDLSFFVRILRHLDEDELADVFAQIRLLLSEAGYFQDPTRELHALPEPVIQAFDQLGARALSNDRLWDLDSKLAQLERTGLGGVSELSRRGA
jgi:hypothetical protein